eukprot:CAMPEP_0175058496 /NCGR_PEP_ID=MMETSP0052_2-20121109/11878_1 /TAXON_ID=51329 ORGANISM="Polytomella parva, Strain SAG 63-3" /NCGR_SAMPLE_ID=MMETSP0052_2 /ASSEMBLY_ACC=CAM_ASM_000194 /LENGTH=505 /DNA_ID=CAMNT_0016323879 /DNA_START=389 /DNA_END=1902 /DNA_ORIENTATION=+
MYVHEERLDRFDKILREYQEVLDSYEAQSLALSEAKWRPFDAQRVAYGDRRLIGKHDARFHSTSWGATPRDYRILPKRIVLVRHAESEGNVDGGTYSSIPDSKVPLTANGHAQAREAGMKLRAAIEASWESKSRRPSSPFSPSSSSSLPSSSLPSSSLPSSSSSSPTTTPPPYKLFFYISPYRRSFQTFQEICRCFPPESLSGVQEEVQLREQDFGNFQNPEGKEREKADRLRFGRFFYRFPDGESGADVYDRLTIFEDHLIRDINAGRFTSDTTLILITHGLSLRIFLMRWFHWTVEQFLSVYNPPNAEPLVLERILDPGSNNNGINNAWRHTKTLYRIQRSSLAHLKGCTLDMCYTGVLPREVLDEMVQEARRKVALESMGRRRGGMGGEIGGKREEDGRGRVIKRRLGKQEIEEEEEQQQQQQQEQQQQQQQQQQQEQQQQQGRKGGKKNTNEERKEWTQDEKHGEGKVGLATAHSASSGAGAGTKAAAIAAAEAAGMSAGG